MRQDFLDELTNLIQTYVRANVNTHLPAKVVAVNKFNDTQTVDVNIQLSRLFTDGNVVNNKDMIIYGVPVVFPSGGGGLMSFPVAVGDTVLLAFSQRCLDEWLLSDGSKEVIPGDSRHYSETDAVAFPGLFTTKSHLSPNPTDVELKFGNCSLKFSPSNVVTLTNGSATFVISGNNVTVTANTINLNGVTIDEDGAVDIPDSLMVAGKELANHTHSGVESGLSNTGVNN